MTTIAIAGATGFVGQALRRHLAPRHQVVGLTRSPTRAALPDAEGFRWQGCDLFSPEAVGEALRGVEVGIYLVHSMFPSARLTQASFPDMDVLLADSFARGAASAGVTHIIYLGGIVPVPGSEEGASLSEHLASRQEVERTLAAHGVSVTVLRAGLILGPGGSSMTMMVNLARRLPVMVLPAWTRSRSAPVFIDDVVRAIAWCVENPGAAGGVHDLGGPDTLTYREMLARTARVLGRPLPSIDVPFMSPGLSRLWVSAISGTSQALVGPLVESLRHEVVPRPGPLHDLVVRDAVPFDEALRRSLDAAGRPLPNPRAPLRAHDERRLKESRTVRSIQRLPRPAGATARSLAEEYLRWLPTFVRPLLRCEVTAGQARFYARSTDVLLLELTVQPGAARPDRHVLDITGGVLVAPGEPRGRFEFREVLGGEHVMAAIHDFRPALPWYLYNLSQARVHLVVMRAFARHLERLSPAAVAHHG